MRVRRAPCQQSAWNAQGPPGVVPPRQRPGREALVVPTTILHPFPYGIGECHVESVTAKDEASGKSIPEGDTMAVTSRIRLRDRIEDQLKHRSCTSNPGQGLAPGWDATQPDKRRAIQAAVQPPLHLV